MDNFLNDLDNDILIVEKSGVIEFCSDSLLLQLEYTKEEIQRLALICEEISMEDIIKMIGVKEEIVLNMHSKYGREISVIGKVFHGKYKGRERLYIICRSDKNHSLAKENQKFLKAVKTYFHKYKEIEEELENFLNTATDLMTIIDGEGRFIKVNKGWEKSLGWSASELLTKNWQDIIHPEDIEDTYKIIEAAKFSGGRIKRIVNRYMSNTGEILWLSWGFKYIEHKNIIIGTARDITERKRLEEKSKLYEKNFELENTKNQFFSNMSHEFRTPLNIILASTEIVSRSIRDNRETSKEVIELNKYMKSIKQNSYRLLRLVNNLIDITKMDSGYYKINLENIDIVSVIEDITISVAHYVENKGIDIIFDTDVEEEVIACDPDKIERIMLNLLSNAIKYTKENGEIRVEIKLLENSMRISVKDNGIGIPQEKLVSIFDRFMQVDNSLTRKSEGSGIGLALVKNLVEMHGGNIEVDSKLGEGCEFTFELPLDTIDCGDDVKISKTTLNSKVEKCTIEFSDIYNI